MWQAAAGHLAAGDPPEVREAFDRLVDAGASGNEAVEIIGTAVAREVGEMLREGKRSDPERFKTMLEELE